MSNRVSYLQVSHFLCFFLPLWYTIQYFRAYAPTRVFPSPFFHLLLIRTALVNAAYIEVENSCYLWLWLESPPPAEAEAETRPENLLFLVHSPLSPSKQVRNEPKLSRRNFCFEFHKCREATLSDTAIRTTRTVSLGIQRPTAGKKAGVGGTCCSLRPL